MSALGQGCVGIDWVESLTPLGNASESAEALLRGEVALAPAAVLGEFGGEDVPLALFDPMEDCFPPRWGPWLDRLLHALPEAPWGDDHHLILFSSSNFGVGQVLGYRKFGRQECVALGTPERSVEWICERYGWGRNFRILSHACVSAQVALHVAAKALEAGAVEKVLVLSFDFLSAFVTGGFHALKILNGAFPAPFAEREAGSIGLGEGVAAAVLTRGAPGGWMLGPHVLFNEMHHMTANRMDGSGFRELLEPLRRQAGGRRLWVKGHGTGTLDAGRLESGSVREFFGEAPLVSWKGSLGHTLGSCGLVELAIALRSMEAGRIPGTVGTRAPTMTDSVAMEAFSTSDLDGFLLLSNAFGGAHAGCIVSHV